MKKWVRIIVLVAILILAIFLLRNFMNINESVNGSNSEKSGNNEEKIKEYSEDIEVVATLDDTIKSNSTWCGTFQLVWNDMQDEVVKKDIEFQKQLEIVEDLNKQTFKEEDISDEYYYKKWGLMTLDLKDEIEKGLEEKFDEPSDILDNLDWSNAPQDDSGYSDDSKTYLFYAMLFREFNFETEFEELDNDLFNGTQEEYKDIEYFGIELYGEESIQEQVDVLYYNSEDDFAVVLNTKEGDEVILAKGNNGNTFSDIYNAILSKEENYDGKKYFTSNDTLKVPNLDFDVLKKYEELIANGDEDKMFYDSEGNTCQIKEAVQTIEMNLDKSGGKVKSEAAITMTSYAGMIEKPEEIENRYFEFDSEFTIFIREGGKDLPYFAANIDDITLFQD